MHLSSPSRTQHGGPGAPVAGIPAAADVRNDEEMKVDLSSFFLNDSDEEVDKQESVIDTSLEEENARLKLAIRMLTLELQSLRGRAGPSRDIEACMVEKPYKSLQLSQSLDMDTRPTKSTDRSVRMKRPRLQSSDMDGPHAITDRRNPMDQHPLAVETTTLSSHSQSHRSKNGPQHPDLEAHQSAPGLHHRHVTRAPRNATNYDMSPLNMVAAYDAINHSDDDEDETEVSFAMDLVGPDPTTTIAHSVSFGARVKERAGWLVGLLVLQSMSSFIISRNEALLQAHLVIVQFLTMLVGAGGNAGNQASVRVIRGLATGMVNDDNVNSFLVEELLMGVALSGILGVAGCIRALVFAVPLAETLAITTSLCTIVFISIVLGALLPLGMKRLHIDPAHSSTTIQVLMDILGVTITVCVSGIILDSPFHKHVTGATSNAV